MNILLDTHILIWILEDSTKLTFEQVTFLKNKNNNKYVSHISLMEMAIKMKLGKLSEVDNLTIADLAKRIKEDGFMLLPIKVKHIASYANVPLHDNHRDPFDRFLIATALSENMSIMTSDEKFKLYQELVSLV